jgi:tRNA wybutosine-synthesizing protein 3
MLFSKEKFDFLNKKDRSRIGKIDCAILPLVGRINSLDDYYTTSSCSGRIAVIEAGRKPAKWVFVSHEKTAPENIIEALSSYSGQKELWFRVEPMILHVRCRSLERAQSLVDIARSIGFRRSGIQATGAKIMVEISSSEIIDALIFKEKALVDSSYIALLAEEADKKLEESHKKIKKLAALI